MELEYLPFGECEVLNKVPNFMNFAKKVAASAPYYRYKLGAVLTRKNTLISVGANQTKSHPLQAKFSNRGTNRPWMHAEIHCLSLANVEDILYSTIYVARVIKSGDFANSRPCAGCHNALKHFGVSTMIYHHDGKLMKEYV